MQVSILGPVEVVRDGRPVTVGGSRVRRLLTRLALDADRPVGAGALADAVWGDDVPGEVPNALQSLASRLRRALGDAAAVVTTPAGGYRLAVSPADVDALRFAELAERAHRETKPAVTIETADEALALWRGAPLADLDPGDAAAEITRLSGLQQRLVEDRAEALLTVGEADRAERELGARFESDPTAERVAALLMRALAATGRPAEALAVFERARAALAETFGVDPSADLQRQHLAVLRAEPEPDGAAVRTNLPAAVSSFVGRDADLERVGELLRASRLVTLVGPGGAGKTRLAVEGGRLAVRLVPDGVWLVELARVTDPGDVVTAVVEALGAWDVVRFDTRRGRRTAPLERLTDALGGHPVMLVLDNCEHLLDAVADLAENLLAACPELRILATSREPLSVAGEALYPVPPLDHDTADRSATELLKVPAVVLFVDRVRAMDPSFELTDANAADVGRICAGLDGLPLALELAAARSRTMPVAQIAERLGERFRLLTGGSRTALPRHRTLRAVVEWSWELLSAAERDLTERLAVFPAGVDRNAVHAVVTAAGLAGDTDDLIAALVDKSLLQRLPDGRYRMLETIREFGTDRLAERHVLADARAVHAEHYFALAREIEPHLRSREQLEWIRVAVVDRDNLLAALQFLCDVGRGDDAVDLAMSLSWLWTLRNEHATVVTWLRRALDVPGGAWNDRRTTAVGLLAMNLGATEGIEAGVRLVAQNRERLSAESAPGDDEMLTLIRSLVPVFLGDAHTARDRVGRSLALPGLSDWTRATLMMIRAYAEENDGDIEAMVDSMTEAAAAFERIGDRFGLSSTLDGRARLQTFAGDLPGAIDSYTRAARLMAELGSEEDFAQSSVWVANLHIRRGDLDAAAVATQVAREHAERVGSPLGLSLVDCAAANLERAHGDAHAADELAAGAKRRFLDYGPNRAPTQLLAVCLVTRAAAVVDLGEFDRAEALLTEATGPAVESHDMPAISIVAVGRALLAAERDEREQAATMLAVADALRGTTDATDVDVRRVETVLAGDETLRRRREAVRAEGRDAALERLLTAAG